MIPTPALQRYIRERGEIDGGVMITASHNPPEFNGIKCIAGDGTECSREQEDLIEKLYGEGVPRAAWNGIGTIESVGGAAEEYIESIASKIDTESVKAAGLKVVVDCGGGCACATAPALMEKLGVSAIVLNGEPDMGNPGRPSEPTEDNLSELMKEVVSSGADLGIAHDGDADRCVFVTSEGRYVPGDLALAILGRDIAKKIPGAKTVITVATSEVVEASVAPAGGTAVYTAVGSPIVARTMAGCGAEFGGEENGGLIFADHQFCRDGGMGAARMIECVVRGGPLGSQLETLPVFRTVKKAAACPEQFKEAAVEQIAKNHPDAKKDLTDGLKLIFPDGWVLLRPSGTEPKFRIYSESRNPETAERRSSEFAEEFAQVLRNLER